MSLDVLASGRLVKPAETRQAKSGSTYAVAQLAVAVEGDDAVLCSLVAFRDTAVECLLALGPGDGVSVAGRARVTTWTGRDGEQKAGLSIVVEQVLTAYAVKRKRQAVQGDAGDADDATPTPAPDRRPQGRDSSRSATPARERGPVQATLPVGTDRIDTLSDDTPF